jgi:ATP adenylyltransferase
MDRLWSPWRIAYVTGQERDTGCVFCDVPRPPQPDSLVVYEGSTGYIVLNKFPYNNGHLMSVPYRHVDSLGALRPDELQELAVMVQLSEVALLEAYQPQGINVGINLGRARGATLDRRLELHDRDRRNTGAAGRARRECGSPEADFRPACCPERRALRVPARVCVGMRARPETGLKLTPAL